MYKKIDQRVATFTVDDVAVSQETVLFRLAKGERILYASSEVLVPADASTDSTVSLGQPTGDDVDGYMTTANVDIEAAVGTIAQGTGALLLASGGRLITAADGEDVSAHYVQASTDGATAPVIRFTIHVLRERV